MKLRLLQNGDPLLLDFGLGENPQYQVYAGLSRLILDFDQGLFKINFRIGTYDNNGGPDLDYEYYSLTGEYNGFYGRIATFENDFDGTYYEAGYGNTLTIEDTDLLDYAFAVIYSDSTLLGGSSDTNFVFTLSKTFDF